MNDMEKSINLIIPFENVEQMSESDIISYRAKLEGKIERLYPYVNIKVVYNSKIKNVIPIIFGYDYEEVILISDLILELEQQMWV